MVKLLWKTVWQFLKKLKINLPSDTAISLLVIYTKELKVGTQRHICTPMFIAALFTRAKMWKCPLTDESINKMWYKNTVKHFSGLEKGNSDKCYMNETWRPYVK